MLALLRSSEEIRTWLGEADGSTAEIKALLWPYNGSLIMCEQEASKPPPERQKPKAPMRKETTPDLF